MAEKDSKQTPADATAGTTPPAPTPGTPTPAAVADRDPDTIPKGKDAGSRVPIVGTPTADFAAPKAKEPEGRQAEEATVTARGSISSGLVPSPSGPVPVSAVARNAEEAEELLEQNRKAVKSQEYHSALDKLSDEFIDTLDAPTLRSIAQQRQYRDFPQGGRRTSREAFKRMQAEDPRYSKKGK